VYSALAFLIAIVVGLLMNKKLASQK